MLKFSPGSPGKPGKNPRGPKISSPITGLLGQLVSYEFGAEMVMLTLRGSLGGSRRVGSIAVAWRLGRFSAEPYRPFRIGLSLPQGKIV